MSSIHSPGNNNIRVISLSSESVIQTQRLIVYPILESLPSLPQEIGSSANSSASGEEFPGLRSNVIAPSLDTVSDHNSRASSLGSSYATTRRGENDSRGSGFQTGQDAQQLTGRPANVTTATASAGLGHSIGSTLCRRSSETSGVRGESSRGESSRAGREQNRRARGQERVLSYLSGVSQAAVLTNFEEDLGIPVPPPPHPPPFLDTIIPRVWWMRILFWAMCALIIFMSPIYIWMVRALLGRT